MEKKLNKSCDFGLRFRKLRKDKGLSQRQLADILGYKHNASISSIEAGKTPLSIETFVKIADVFETDLHWLITGETIPHQKRIVSQYKERYSNLVKEYQDAQDTIQRLEAKKQSGQPLTTAEEQEIKNCLGVVRTRVRYMEMTLEAAAQELTNTNHP
jgi:transcriptional regulator with XRE-family HTH domain